MPSIRAQQLIDWIVQHLGKPDLMGVEIGVNPGATSRDLLKRFPKLHLLMVDPWKSGYGGGDRMSKQPQEWHDQARNEALKATEFASDRRSVFETTWAEAAMFVESIDFSFIDGNHSYEAVRLDSTLVWERLVPGGLMMGHDYNRPSVKRAVMEFAESLAEQRSNETGKVEGIAVLTGEHATWMIIKPQDTDPKSDRSLWRKE